MLEFIRERGPVSRAQLARDSGLSKPAVSQALSALEASKLVREAGRTSGGKGPTAILYELNPGAGWVVGLDVGTDRIRAAIADLTGQIVARRDEPARARSASALIARIGGTARALAADVGVGWKRISYVVMGSPGVVEIGRAHVWPPDTLPSWVRHGRLDAVRGELGTPVTLENDVNLAALGERSHGLGKDVRNFVYLHVGTGVGMGLILNGELFRGATGVAGEVGYMPLATQDPHEPANRIRGSLEQALGAAGVVAAARAAGMAASVTPKGVFAAARKGDERAAAVVETVAQRLALAIAAIVPVVDPELVILGGGIGRNGDLLLEPVEQELRTLSPFRPRIEISPLGEDAELQGAVSMALEAAQDRLFARADGREASVFEPRTNRGVRRSG